MVLRSGKVDLYHTREASEATQRLIPGAQIADPPWGDDEWYMRTGAQGPRRGPVRRLAGADPADPRLRRRVSPSPTLGSPPALA
jgi:hypothetical protein